MARTIDDELAEALAATERNEAPPAPTHHRNAPPKRRNVGLLVALLALACALIALFMVGFRDAAVYAITVDKLVEGRASLVGRKVRVEGELVPGTLARRERPCEYRFTLHKDQVELPVRYAQCVIPDTFRDMPGGGVQVTVEGSLTAKGDFEASLVMAKCASKYDPSTHQMKPTEGTPKG